MIKYIDELGKEELKGKRVLLRLDLNVPVEDGIITDTHRLDKAISTVDYLRLQEAKVIILAHLENKEGGNESLLPIYDHLNGFFKLDFCPTYFTPEAVEKVLKLEDKNVLLFENVRINPGEKENDSDFSKKLSQMADFYVNDAFSVSHRKHASIVGVPEFLPHYGGLLLREEIENLSKVFQPKHPFVFILGGAKFVTKLPLIKKYLNIADTVFVGGALANDVFIEEGFEVGKSLVSKGDFGIKEMLTNPKFKTFKDVTVTNESNEVLFKEPSEVGKNDCIVDAGPETLNHFREVLNEAKTIVWNGPLGNYEKGFADKTESLAEMIAEFTEKNGAESIVGGGDTVASINKLGLDDKFTFISTGGGAMLDFLVNETLVGLQALEK
jgi:phosphoglycerate kinase